MANDRLTDRALYAGTLDLADILHIVDVSDNTQDPAGSSYKLNLSQLKTFLGAWTLNGNTVGAEKWIGTADNFDFPIRTNNTEKMRVTSAGSVGIGTTTIPYILTVNSANAVDFISIAENDSLRGILGYGASGGLLELFDTDGTTLLMRINDGGADFIDTGLNLGLGVLSASEKLQVAGNIAPEANNTRDLGTASLGWANLYMGSSVHYTTDLLFKTATVEKMRLSTAGDLGIGVTATARLHVKGSGVGTGYSLKIQNSASADLFQVRDDGYILAGNSSGNLTIGYDSFFDTSTSGNTFIGTNIGGAVTAQENTALGANALASLTTGSAVGRNVAIGKDSMLFTTTGNLNTAVGFETLYNNVGGADNNAFGRKALYTANNNYNNAFGSRCLTLCTGGENTAMGDAALASMTSGDFNCAFGLNAGVSNITGDRNVFLGYSSGFFETNSDRLYIDNRARTDLADAVTKALIYGVFNASVASQEIHFNAAHINMDDLPVGRASVSVGELFVDTAANVLANGDYVVARKV